jgi:hypothetical protein
MTDSIGEILSTSRLLAVQDSETLAAQLAERYVAWSCKRCGEELTRRRDVPPPPGSLCAACSSAGQPSVAPPLRITTREQALARYGVPAVHRVPFLEPEAWPKDVRRPDFDLSQWAGEPWCVLLAGVVEGGKTMMATELFLRRLPHAKKSFWTRAGTAIKALFGSFGEEAASQMARNLYESDLLVFDEIGRGHEGRAWTAIVEVVSHRHEHQLPSLFTTNRRLRTRPEDKEAGLADEDPAMYRRLAEGFIGGFTRPWAAGGTK